MTQFFFHVKSINNQNISINSGVHVYLCSKMSLFNLISHMCLTYIELIIYLELNFMSCFYIKY